MAFRRRAFRRRAFRGTDAGRTEQCTAIDARRAGAGLRRDGRCLAAAEDFARAGGTDLVLVHCPDFAAPPTDEAGHRAAYADTVAMAEEVRASVGLGVRVVLGPHPAAFAHQFEAWSVDGEAGRARAVEAYTSSIDVAVAFIDEGKAHAVGEVGRPHWRRPLIFEWCFVIDLD